MLQLCNTGLQTILLAQPQRDAVPVHGVMSNVSFTFDKHVDRQRQSVYIITHAESSLGLLLLIGRLVLWT